MHGAADDHRFPAFVPIDGFTDDGSPTVYIRDDENTYTISQEDAMKNVPNSSENYVVVPKVVK